MILPSVALPWKNTVYSNQEFDIGILVPNFVNLHITYGEAIFDCMAFFDRVCESVRFHEK